MLLFASTDSRGDFLLPATTVMLNMFLAICWNSAGRWNRRRWENCNMNYDDGLWSRKPLPFCHFAPEKGIYRSAKLCWVCVHTIDTGVILSVSREELLVVGICRRVDLELHWINYWNVVNNVVVLICLSKPKIFCNNIILML